MNEYSFYFAENPLKTKTPDNFLPGVLSLSVAFRLAVYLLIVMRLVLLPAAVVTFTR